LGEIPEGWILKRLGHFFFERREKVSDKDFQPLSVTKNGIVPRLETAAKTQDGDNRKKVIAGDFVINSRSDRKGSSGLSELDGSVSLICIVLEPNEISGRFAHHLFRSEMFQEEFYRNGKGIVADLWSTGFSEMKNIVIPVPSLPEQTQIARFLDQETAKIDTLIREQERLIALLQEKRQAVISHAVTKGLDPNVPMKDSGVEWLGEVPAHWLVGKLRWYATIQGGIAKGKDYEDKKTVSLPYLRVANVQVGYVDLTVVKEIAVLESEIERYSLKSGDVLMNEGGDNDKLGRGTVWKAEIEPCLHQNHVFAIRPNEHLNPEWLAIFTQSSRARSYFYLNSKQSTNLASISSSNVMNLDLPMPPVGEQCQILDFLANELLRFTELQSQAETGIRLLSERRSALISAAVTGKIDVRNWQPPSDESAFGEEVRQAGMEATA
jgi:type I restriction enzyme S subunit